MIFDNFVYQVEGKNVCESCTMSIQCLPSLVATDVFSVYVRAGILKRFGGLKTLMVKSQQGYYFATCQGLSDRNSALTKTTLTDIAVSSHYREPHFVSQPCFRR